MAVCWEIATHSAYDMVSEYKYLIVNLFFPPRLLKWEFLSDCAFSFPGHCLLVPFSQLENFYYDFLSSLFFIFIFIFYLFFFLFFLFIY